MSRIAEIGNRLLGLQDALGLNSSKIYKQGFNRPDLLKRSPFGNVAWSELHDLYCWKNGIFTKGNSKSQLWISPGYSHLSVEDAEVDRSYAAKYLDDWDSSWYPVLTDSFGGRMFVNFEQRRGNLFPVFTYDPYLLPTCYQIYESLESMLGTFLVCYEQHIYHLSDDTLTTDFKREVSVARELNPHSDFWTRKDLF
jgi:hypothetical protein